MNANGFYGIGTDAKVRGLAEGQWFGVPNVDDTKDSPPKDWNETSFLVAAKATEVRPGQFPLGFKWETTFEVKLSLSPKDGKAKAAYMYLGAFAGMEVEKVVCVRDVVGSELCISSNNGEKVFDALKSAISQGKKVRLSFENIKSLSASFLDSAIGQLYNGEIQGDIDEKLSFEDISPGRRLVTERAIREAKAYYSDPEGYSAKMKKIFADD